MPKHVLSVGQCVPDDSSLKQFLTRHFDVEFSRSASKAAALEQIRTTSVDLILVNRKLDADYSDGMEIIKSIQADPDINTTPVMLVSNYADAQEAAVVAGAENGFGKNELGDPAVVDRLRKYLG